MNDHVRLFLNLKFCVYLLALCIYKERQNEEKEKERKKKVIHSKTHRFTYDTEKSQYYWFA